MIVTLIAESRSHMEQLMIHLQELFKWAAMKNKAFKVPKFIVTEKKLQRNKVFC